MRPLLFTLLFINSIFGQVEIVSTQNSPCYSYKNITVVSEQNSVEAIIEKPITLKKEIEVIYENEIIFYFYKKILFMMEIKKYKSPCLLDNFNSYEDDDIMVSYNKELNRTLIYSKFYWELIKKKRRK